MERPLLACCGSRKNMGNQILALLYNAGEGFVSVVPVWFVHFSAVVLGFFLFCLIGKRNMCLEI